MHAPERPAAAFWEKCLKYQKDSDCGEFAKLGARIRDKCIDCHMPVQESNLIISNANGKEIKADAESRDQSVFGAGELDICGVGHGWKCVNKLLRDSASVG